MFFDIALTWDARSDMKRRKSTHSGGPAEEIQLPSWSWIGWQGGVLNAREGIDDLETWSFSGIETFPITEWFAIETPYALVRRIKSQWFDYKDQLSDLSKPLPPGWSRHDYTPRRPGTLYPKGGGKYCFTHESLPNARFWHPVPIFDESKSIQQDMSQSMPYISCQAQRAWFLACPRGVENIYSGRFAILKNIYGEDVGELCMNSSTDMEVLGPELLQLEDDDIAWYDDGGSDDDEVADDYESEEGDKTSDNDRTSDDVGSAAGGGSSDDGETSNDDELSGELIELVAIAGSRDNRKEREYKSYHILWVQWVDKVAYRRGHGMVKWSAWKAACPETVDLVLG